MLLKIDHSTKYNYDEPVFYGLQQVRLTPHSQVGQVVKKWETNIEGGFQELEFDDQHKNRVLLASLENNQKSISVHCRGEVETRDLGGVYGEENNSIPLWFYKRPTKLTAPGQQINELANSFSKQSNDSISRLHSLSRAIYERVTYQTGKTKTATLAEEALVAGHGVCQDHAHIFIAAARLINFPARYVSGYLMMNDRVEQDATHAWAEVYVQNIGWVGFDVSNNISPDERYVRVATGLDYKEAAPITGLRFGDSNEDMLVTLQVQQ